MLIARTRWLKRRSDFRHRRFLQRTRRTVAMLESTWNSIQFKKTFRMNQICFRNLVEILHPYLPSNNQQKSPNGFISSDIRIGITLRYLSGGSPLDICNMFGIGLSTVTVIVYQVVSAINKAFTIKFPESHIIGFFHKHFPMIIRRGIFFFILLPC